MRSQETERLRGKREIEREEGERMRGEKARRFSAKRAKFMLSIV
jgi:hypothetical protein